MNRIALASVAALTAVLVLPLRSPSASPPGFVETVKSTHPVAYYRLTGNSGASEVGATNYTLTGTGSPSTSCAPVHVPNNTCVTLDGSTGYFDTTQMGGIGGNASILAWVNLNALPSGTGRIVYVAGISQDGNDLDLQFEADNALRFYTVSGSNVAFKPPVATLAGRWHMIVATFSSTSGTRAIYWDGKLGWKDSGGGKFGKTNEFSIGESKVFRGRYFTGTITDVALWNRTLSPATVAAIYQSRLNAP
jgi:hypothetical protein